jgi:hypothetical protein
MAEQVKQQGEEFWTSFKANKLTLWGEKGTQEKSPCCSLLVTHSGAVKFQVRTNSNTISNNALDFSFGSSNELRNFFSFLNMMEVAAKNKGKVGTLFSAQCKTRFANNIRLDEPKTTHVVSVTRDEKGIMAIVFTVKDNEIRFPFWAPDDYVYLDENNEQVSAGQASEAAMFGWSRMLGEQVGAFIGTSLRQPAPKDDRKGGYAKSAGGSFNNSGNKGSLADFDDVD